MMQTKKYTIHAVLRYLERVEGVDIERVCQHLEEVLDTPMGRRAVDFMGDAGGKFKVGGIIYCIRDGRIITCYLR